MKGLLLNNFLYAKYTLKGSILFLSIFLIIGTFTGNIPFLTTILVVVGLNQTMTSMSYDDSYNWNTFALTSPTNRKKLVISKFIFSYSMILLSGFISLIFGFVAANVFNNISFIELLLALAASLIVCLYMVNSIIPLIYKFGVEKSRMFLMIIIFIPFFLIGIFLQVFPFNEEMLSNFLKVSPIILIVYSILSIKLSIKILEKKDL